MNSISRNKVNPIVSFIAMLSLLSLVMSPAGALDLQCNGTRHPDGFIYQLSQPIRPNCSTQWVDENKTVIARNFKYDKALVHSLNNRSITLNECREYLLFTEDCLWRNVRVEETCRANCSQLLDQDPPPPTVNSTKPPVNSTKICFSENHCMDQTTFGLVITGVLLFFSFCVGLYCCVSKCRGTRSAKSMASYTAPTEQIKIELVV
ncbi:uncharacterized protein LOC108883464 [Lates calcarifer]|uniref:Uncharacterized protein LOC108883464 n=1 Tax=Lates calcarifer TaxID=8187 RepID=A0AAJ7LW14_LATCA|nr:uncharacterized protein LOC108883464 [Lates calcarifer]